MPRQSQESRDLQKHIAGEAKGELKTNAADTAQGGFQVEQTPEENALFETKHGRVSSSFPSGHRRIIMFKMLIKPQKNVLAAAIITLLALSNSSLGQSVDDYIQLVVGLLGREYGKEITWKVSVEQIEDKSTRQNRVLYFKNQLSQLDKKNPDYQMNKHRLELRMQALEDEPAEKNFSMDIKAFFISPSAWKIVQNYDVAGFPESVTFISDGAGTTLEINDITRIIKVGNNPQKLLNDTLRGSLPIAVSFRINSVRDKTFALLGKGVQGLSFAAPSTDLNCVIEFSKSLSYIEKMQDLSGDNQIVMKVSMLSQKLTRVELFSPKNPVPFETQNWHLVSSKLLDNFNIADLEYKVKPGYTISILDPDGADRTFKSDVISGKRISQEQISTK